MTLSIRFIAITISILVLTSCKNKVEVKEHTEETKQELVKRVFSLAEHQYDYLINKIDTISPLLNPRSLNKDGSLRMAYKQDWTCGFFPGSLWYLYEQTNDNKWKIEAEKFTEALDSAQFVKWNHDVGFMIQNSFGQGYRLTGNETYKQAVVDAAKSLSTRYRPVAKVIQSWDTDAPWIQGKGLDMPIIIDNMMNLNLLYQATKHTADSTFANIANAHATTTIKNQYRPDYSCYHIIDYDHITGDVRKKVNFQGYADESAWARGQAWGLYGYTEAYKESGHKIFLEHAKKIANYIMNNDKIPDDNIPYWDYDAESTEEIPRDASAAAIVASALLELQAFDSARKNEYLDYTETILRTLSSDDYLAQKNENGGFILKHSVGNFHENNETDAPLNYADYYYLEALIRWSNI
ncbi:glycoside hydrolase family 88 protein [Winogradskyella psychrotolerans]|uniref:glycoside hydrolase family 88 protein n=1 Tax=Winogradskyella TaxID=286104 RepID=UPI001C07D64E|nr:glycoside hydrolase family 88 protein [Winogradskyella psychrotolerans]MBU2921566.1 glycoside hydrolase family 88 protein [Winogradskyella psychrotolerans]